MKVIVNENSTSKDIEYPCLMKSDIIGFKVLFIRYGVGTQIGDNLNKDYVGFYSEAWNMDCFKPFKGPITLSND